MDRTTCRAGLWAVTKIGRSEATSSLTIAPARVEGLAASTSPASHNARQA